MTREEKIKAIYKEMANKELTLGYKVYMTESHWPFDWVVIDNNEDWIDIWREDKMMTKELNNPHIEIIWHPVMIGTVFEWYSSSRWFINSQFVMELIDKWTGYDNPIDDQSQECIDYVYSLIQKN